MEQSSLTSFARPDRFGWTCQVGLTAGRELLQTIDAVGVRNVPYINYTTLWVDKQQAALATFIMHSRGDLFSRSNWNERAPWETISSRGSLAVVWHSGLAPGAPSLHISGWKLF
jgi:hypothetical protein